MLDHYPPAGTQHSAMPFDSPPERSYNFVCRRCGQRFSVPRQQLRNPNVPDDTPCPNCGSSYCHREAGLSSSPPSDD
jgi:hypothetical protein